MSDSFSQRHGLAGPPAGTLLRDEVPPSFRMFLIDLAHSPEGPFDLVDMQKVICRVLQVFPDLNGPHFHCSKHIRECAWFSIYDIIEGLYRVIDDEVRHSYGSMRIQLFVTKVNKALMEDNIGWQLADGKVVTRGDEVFEGTVKTAVTVLEEAGKPTAAGHLRAAIRALSVRPNANTSGAVSQATNAVECVLGEITGEVMTLGKYLDKHPGLLHPSLKKGLDGIYGYASDEGARHGKEGTEPAREDAEFVLATCAALCTLLMRKHAGAQP